MLLEKYSDLPTACPACTRKFAESNFHFRFKPRFQVSNLMMLVLAAIPACTLCVMFLPGLLGLFAATGVLGWLLVIARSNLVAVLELVTDFDRIRRLPAVTRTV